MTHSTEPQDASTPLESDRHAPAHDSEHSEDALGPVDIPAWSAGILGVAIALVMTGCFVLATAGTGAY